MVGATGIHLVTPYQGCARLLKKTHYLKRFWIPKPHPRPGAFCCFLKFNAEFVFQHHLQFMQNFDTPRIHRVVLIAFNSHDGVPTDSRALRQCGLIYSCKTTSGADKSR
jgi:hypothetical protein